MAAGLGFKDFVTGEVLTAGDVDGYLMQGIWVFASAAARDAAVTSPQEGNFAFLKDTNTTTYYTGSAWTNLDTTGMVNPMTTTGDTIYSSSGSTPARLGIGSTGQVLTVSGGLPVWATPSGGGSGMTLITNNSFSAVSAVNINNCFSSTYKNYKIMTSYTTSANAGSSFRFRNSGSDITTSTYFFSYIYIATGTQLLQAYSSQTQYGTLGNTGVGATNYMFWELTDVFASSAKFGTFSNWADNGNFNEAGQGQFKNTTASTFDGFSIYPGSGTITGSVQVYGLAN